MLCSRVLKTFPRLDLDMGKEVDLEKQRAYAARLETTLASAPNGHVFFDRTHLDLDDVRRLQGHGGPGLLQLPTAL